MLLYVCEKYDTSNIIHNKVECYDLDMERLKTILSYWVSTRIYFTEFPEEFIKEHDSITLIQEWVHPYHFYITKNDNKYIPMYKTLQLMGEENIQKLLKLWDDNDIFVEDLRKNCVKYFNEIDIKYIIE